MIDAQFACTVAGTPTGVDELCKASFSEAALIANVKAFIGAISRSKPSGAKGSYIHKVCLSSTMGPGVKLEISSVLGGG